MSKFTHRHSSTSACRYGYRQCSSLRMALNSRRAYATCELKSHIPNKSQCRSPSRLGGCWPDADFAWWHYCAATASDWGGSSAVTNSVRWVPVVSRADMSLSCRVGWPAGDTIRPTTQLQALGAPALQLSSRRPATMAPGSIGHDEYFLVVGTALGCPFWISVRACEAVLGKCAPCPESPSTLPSTH